MSDIIASLYRRSHKSVMKSELHRSLLVIFRLPDFRESGRAGGDVRARAFVENYNYASFEAVSL